MANRDEGHANTTPMDWEQAEQDEEVASFVSQSDMRDRDRLYRLADGHYVNHYVVALEGTVAALIAALSWKMEQEGASHNAGCKCEDCAGILPLLEALR